MENAAPCKPTSCRRTGSQQGSVIIVVIMFVLLLSFVPILANYLQTSHRSAKLQMNTVAQAENVARAGLAEAISWFRSQTPQPVASSNRDPGSFPYADAVFKPLESANVTLDEDIGLVREFQITGSDRLWGRYEVRRQAQDPTVAGVDTQAVHDITDKRHIPGGAAAGQGVVWQIQSFGFVYRRVSPTAPFDQLPNEVVGSGRATTEIRRLTVNLPAQAALIVQDLDDVAVRSQARVDGGDSNIGVASCRPGSLSSGETVLGTPPTALVFNPPPGDTCPFRMDNVFTAAPAELLAMADLVADQTSLPAALPDRALVYIQGDVEFDAALPLKGGGVLIVDGDLTIRPNTNSVFRGVIYVTGDVDIKAPAWISGAVVAEGRVTLEGAADQVGLEYDEGMVAMTQNEIGEYRENKTAHTTLPLVRRK